MRNSKMSRKSLTSEMDQSVKRMLKLIEEDGDTFAKKAEMYYQKRPELISHVEEFYRMYRSLAERYDHHLAADFRKNIPSDLQSQCSGISDISFETPSTLPSPDPHRFGRTKSGHRVPGFDVFLSSAGNSLEGYESCTLDYESGSDESSVNNDLAITYIGESQGLRLKMIELEVELRDVKERLRVEQEENADEKLRAAKERIRVLQEENGRLRAGIAERDDRVEGLNEILDALKSRYEMVMVERSEMKDKMVVLVDEVRCRDERIDEMSRDLEQSETEYVELIGGRERAGKVAEELRLRVRQLEKEVESQRTVILEGAEEKREAIRQLCFSLEHYRNGYHRLREAFMGHKGLPIMATEFIK